MVYERLMATARNYFRLSAEALRHRQFMKAAETASAAFGIFTFLMEDPETPEDIRTHVNRVAHNTKNRIFESHLRWMQSKLAPRMSGRDAIEVQIEEYIEGLDRDLREAARAAIQEIES